MTILDPLRGFIAKLQGGRFDLAGAVAALDRPRRPVLRALDMLVKEGYLIEVADTAIPPGPGGNGPCRRNPTWQVNPKKDVAKRPTFKKPRRNTTRDKMWKLIRAQRRFTRSYLQRLIGCSLGGVEDYTKLLEREGIIREIGKEGPEKLFLLVKDSGVNRPQIKEAAPAKEVANG